MIVDSIRKSKVQDVRGFELLRFDARMLAEDHWLEVHTFTVLVCVWVLWCAQQQLLSAQPAFSPTRKSMDAGKCEI